MHVEVALGVHWCCDLAQAADIAIVRHAQEYAGYVAVGQGVGRAVLS